MPFAQIALPLPVPRPFTFPPPEPLSDRVALGAQVQVPFRGRPRRGFVVAIERESPLPADAALQEISAVLGAPLFGAHLLALTRWIADYYLAPWGEVLAAALPGGLEGFAKSRARSAAASDPTTRLALPERMTLTAGQRDALRAVERAIERGGFAPMLLQGVTASGKTELYLRAADRVRAAGGQTLVMVPEVALGSQLVREFRRRFGARVGVLHSYLPAGERRRNWELARRGALDEIGRAHV